MNTEIVGNVGRLVINRDDLVCQICGDRFGYRRERGAGRLPRFCSDECRRQQARITASRSARRTTGPRPKNIAKNCEVCGGAFTTSNSATRTCGRGCGYRLVSEAVRRQGAARRIFADRREKWRNQNHLRRTRMENGAAEKISARQIFERDGWVCGLCGGKVNRRLKFPHPKSASLDHIVPLSIGGAHIARNVQCAHLSCNSTKQAGAGGQLRLFG